MAKILNYRNYHKITQVDQHQCHQSHLQKNVIKKETQKSENYEKKLSHRKIAQNLKRKSVQQHLKTAQQHLKSSQQHLKNFQQHLKTPQQHLKFSQQHLNSSQQHQNAISPHKNNSQQHLKTPQQYRNNSLRNSTNPQQYLKKAQKTCKISNHIKSDQQTIEYSPEHLKPIPENTINIQFHHKISQKSSKKLLQHLPKSDQWHSPNTQQHVDTFEKETCRAKNHPKIHKADVNKSKQLTSYVASNMNQQHQYFNEGDHNKPASHVSMSSASSLASTSSLALPSTSSNLYTTSTIANSTTISYTTNSCCFLTYNLFAAYAEAAATFQLKRKTSLNKLFYNSPGTVRRHSSAMDIGSVCYLILMAMVYWGVMIKAASATTPTLHSEGTTATTTTMGPMDPLGDLITANLSLRQGNNDVTLEVVNSSTTSIIYTPNMNSQKSLENPLMSISSASSSSSSAEILTNYQRRLLTRREAANVPDFDDDDSSYHDDEFDEYETLIRNKSAKGKYIGAPCNNMTCEPTLLHVTCDKETQLCGCEKNYPVQLGLTRGCDKPKKLGEMCFYDETCQYNDENSLCVQVRHNAMCQCANGYHSVSFNKPPRRVFCTQDIDELNSDLPTLLGVCVGIGVLAGLICMVLHLFSKTKYPRHRNFGDANLPPPIMYSSETVQSGRPSSRSSMRSSGGSIGSYGNRRSSMGGVTSTTAGSKGILVSTSRTGSRRPSLASVHSTSSSVRSYSMMRFEKEQQQKEIRHEMKLRLARLQQHQQQQQLGQYKPQIIIGDTATTMQQHGIALNRVTMATPSPMTPNSTDELLPSVDENPEYPHTMELQTKPCPESVASATLSAIDKAAATTGTNPKLSTPSKNTATTAAATNVSGAGGGGSVSTAATTLDIAGAAAYIGPCNSSTEAL
ncbi:uncharacterized protein LOC142234280 [Haematobia irritans]|uniref:uncharacterized protein LOC142234280 n=1 Tax=Haematobia irritans TaxID=7368 RepID=UPI003F4FF4B1